MKKSAAEVRLFFYSQHLADGLRTTIAALLPALIGSFLGDTRTGMLFSLGALCVSLSDILGAIINRKNTMLFCIAFVFATALITGYARTNEVIMGIVVALLCFFFSMFLVYGQRGAAVGNAALLVMVLSTDLQGSKWSVPVHSLFIMLGGFWYMAISLIAQRARPFRTAQRTLGESIRELAFFLHTKADFYDTTKSIAATHDKLLAQQAIVTEKQEAVREVLFKTRQVVQDSSRQGRRLLLAFTDTVDLFEEITAAYYDYELLRKNFAGTNVLSLIADTAHRLANELDVMGTAIQTNSQYTTEFDTNQLLQNLKATIDEAAASGNANTLVLKKLLVNIRRMVQHMQNLQRYFNEGEQTKLPAAMQLHRFVEHQSLQPRLLLDNLHNSSATFRHATRVAIAAVVGFYLAKLWASGHHSYWILMTIIFMLKPSFSLTRQRNGERIVGTLAGGGIGIGILLLQPPHKVLFVIMVFFMIGSYSFMRFKYLLSVIFMTAFILILFSFLGVGFVSLLQERIIDTLVGCIIALLAGYLLFPNWESQALQPMVMGLFKANYNYLLRTTEILWFGKKSATDYKLARKEVYTATANLSAAFRRMLSEPRSKQKNRSDLQQYLVLSQTLTSNIAVLATHIGTQQTASEATQKMLRKTLGTLYTGLEQYNQAPDKADFTSASANQHNGNTGAEDGVLVEQLAYMQHLSEDLSKSMEKLN